MPSAHPHDVCRGARHPGSRVDVRRSFDAALAMQPITPETTAPDRRKRFKVIGDGKKDGAANWGGLEIPPVKAGMDPKENQKGHCASADHTK
jgi:hypothetical protein